MATPPDSRVGDAPVVNPAPSEPSGQCRNCGADVNGAWCSNCGQETRLALPSAGTFLRESAGRYVALDGRFWRTMFALLLRPGFLTREYFAGRRRRYVRPSRLILVLSIALFALLRMMVDPPMLVSGPAGEREPADARAQPDVEKRVGPTLTPGNPDGARSGPGQAMLQLDDEGELTVSVGDGRVMNALRPRIDQFNRLPRHEKIEQVFAGVLRYGPYALIALLPVFALLLKLVYLGRRRRYPRRPHRYAEHLVFAAHFNAYLCLVLIFAMIPFAPLQSALLVWTAIYAMWSMHAVYGGRWTGVVLRGAVIFLSYTILFALAMAGLVVTAILLR